jgi:hypothetical protein
MGEILVKAESGGGSAAFIGPPSSSADTKLKLPADTGSAGQVLKVKSANHSATNAELEWGADAGGEVVKIRTVRDGGNVSAITEDIDTSIYRAYNVIGAFKPVTDQAYLNFYWRAGDPKADLTASSYEWGVIYPYPDDNHYADAHHAHAAIELLQNAGNSDREGWRLNLWMFPNVSGDAGPDISNFCTWHGARIDQSSDFRAGIGSGNYDAAANPNGFTLKPNTGNFAAYTYSLYGLKA